MPQTSGTMDQEIAQIDDDEVRLLIQISHPVAPLTNMGEFKSQHV